MNAKSAGKALRKPVACWLSLADYARLEEIVKRSGVNFSSYIRSMIIDVLADEEERTALRGVGLSVSNTPSCKTVVSELSIELGIPTSHAADVEGLLVPRRD